VSTATHCIPWDAECLLCNPDATSAPLECVVCHTGVDYDKAVVLNPYKAMLPDTDERDPEFGPAHEACRAVWRLRGSPGI
jgi:hypothetical protein